MRLLRGTVLILVVSAASASAQTVTGIVFEDRNGNGRFDHGEPGVPDVEVSNQIEVTLSGKDGRYQLPARDEMILFVTQPVDYLVPVDENNLPQFFYVHDLDGSPARVAWRYETMKPTGELPAAVDFPLIRSKHKNPFRVIAMADPQPRNEREIDFVRDDVVAGMMHDDAEMAIVHGDIMFDDLSLFERQNRVFASLGMPVWNVPGNHDMNYPAPSDNESLETFKRIFGPPYYSHDYADVHFMTLKNVHYKGVTPDGKSGGYTGFFSEEQLKWIENDLRYVPMDKLIVISTHIPFKAFQGDDESINTTNRAEVFKLLEGRKYILLLAGHTHTNDHVYIGGEDGWHSNQPIHQHVLGTVSGTWWMGPLDERGIPAATMRDGAENGYHLFSFNGNEYSSVFVPASWDRDYQLRVTLDFARHRDDYDGVVYEMRGDGDDIIRTEQLFAAKVVANVFNGAPQDQVSMTVDDRDPLPMEHTVRYDPFFTESKAYIKQYHQPNEMNYWGEELSSHIWEAKLPQDLLPGAHAIRVNCIDQYGQSLTGTKIFEIVAP